MTDLTSIKNRFGIIGNSEALNRALEVALRVAPTDLSVLVTGESGVGKEFFPQVIHAYSARKHNKYIAVNCGAIPEGTIDSELFGHEKGAFTGASASGKTGLFEVADGGTLFLDEINSLPLNLQGKLLRAIETKTIQHIGSTKTKEVDFRLIVATNESLKKLVEEKAFRIDLYYRLNVIPIVIPPLRNRKEDIIPLANHFLKFFCEKYDKQKCFSPQMISYMQAYHWPGNVRELRNFVERSVVMSIGNVMNTPNLLSSAEDGAVGQKEPPYASQNPIQGNDTNAWQNHVEDLISDGVSLKNFMSQCEETYIKLAGKKVHSTYDLADLLGTSQTSVVRKKKKYGL